MGMNFPNSPADGQVHTEEGVTFVWNAAAATWIMLGGESEIADPATIATSGSGPNGNWQIMGDMLICFGGTTGVTTGSKTVIFPKTFKSAPSVTMFPETGAVGTPRFFTASSITETQFLFQGFSDAGAQSNAGGKWIAIGEALDADKMPKIVQTVGGVTDFATQTEARAGTVTDKVMSPALVRSLCGAIESGSLVGLASYDFTGIPDEATEIDVLINFAGPNIAGANFAIRPNNVSSGYISCQNRMKNGVASVITEDTAGFQINLPAATDNVFGNLMIRKAAIDDWTAYGSFRLNATTNTLITGTGPTLTSISSLRLVPGGGGNFAVGSARLSWRI